MENPSFQHKIPYAAPHDESLAVLLSRVHRYADLTEIGMPTLIPTKASVVTEREESDSQRAFANHAEAKLQRWADRVIDDTQEVERVRDEVYGSEIQGVPNGFAGNDNAAVVPNTPPVPKDFEFLQNARNTHSTGYTN